MRATKSYLGDDEMCVSFLGVITDDGQSMVSRGSRSHPNTRQLFNIVKNREFRSFTKLCFSFIIITHHHHHHHHAKRSILRRRPKE